MIPPSIFLSKTDGFDTWHAPLKLAATCRNFNSATCHLRENLSVLNGKIDRVIISVFSYGTIF
jgi:hypothetical protein